MSIVLSDADPGEQPGEQPDKLSITFIGTATVIMRCGGFTILTDPNFLHSGEHAYVGMGLWTRRLTEPAIQLDELPPIDFVVLSHHHEDHFDRRVSAGLDKTLPIVTVPQAAKKLRSQGFARPIPLHTWQSETFARGRATVTVTSVPGKHAPAVLGRFVPPVMGSVLEFRDGERLCARVYITGDTLMHDGLAEIPRRFPELDMCIIHLGGTKIAGILLTMDGSSGAEALRLIGPKEAIPVHYDDYTLFRSPLADFKAALEQTPAPTTRVEFLERGQTYSTVTGRSPRPAPS